MEVTPIESGYSTTSSNSNVSSVNDSNNESNDFKTELESSMVSSDEVKTMEAANSLETYFIYEMIKHTEKTMVPKEDGYLEDSNADKIMADFLAKTTATSLAASDKVALSDKIYKELMEEY